MKLRKREIWCGCALIYSQYRYLHGYLRKTNHTEIYTVNVDIFEQFISCRALDARKIDVSENYNHNRTNRIKWYVREYLTTGICLLRLDVQNFSCAKISTFTVHREKYQFDYTMSSPSLVYSITDMTTPCLPSPSFTVLQI